VAAGETEAAVVVAVGVVGAEAAVVLAAAHE